MIFSDKISELRGILVVDYENGQQLGKVVDIFIDKKAKHIMGISFKAWPLGHDAPSYTAIENVLKIGKDVVIIAGPEAVTPVPQELARSSLRALKGLSVTTRDGELLGELTDLNVNSDNGQIREIILSEGKKLVIEVEAVSFGPHMIVVPAEYGARLQPIEHSKSGLLGHIFHTAVIGETVKETSQHVGQRVRMTAEKMSQAVKQSLQKKSHKPSEEDKREEPEKQTFE